MIKQLVSITLAFCFATALYGAENKPKKQTKTSAKSLETPIEQIKSAIPKVDENEFEVSKSETMPKVIPPVIRDNKTEIVYDPTTKLMWQDNKEAKIVQKPWIMRDNYNKRIFNDTSGDTATTYCKNLRLGGYSDWRLPDIKELLSITDMTRYNPAIKSGFQNVNANFYWSSSTNADYSGNARHVFFDGGYGNSSHKNHDLLVRCVRDSN